MAGSTCLWAVMWIFGSRTTKNVFSGEGLRNCCGPLACNPLPNHLFRNRGNGTFEDVTGMCCKDWKRDKQRLGRRGIAGELRGCCGLAMHDWSSRAVLLPAGFLQHIRLSGVPLFSYVYHEYVPLMDGDGKIGVSHPDVELMLHARNHGAPTGSGRECEDRPDQRGGGAGAQSCAGGARVKAKRLDPIPCSRLITVCGERLGD